MKFDIYKLLEERPLSWSALSSFEYDPFQWWRKYVQHGKCTKLICALAGKPDKKCPAVETSPAMEFGKMVGDRIASDPKYLPFFPRLSTFELKLKHTFGRIPLVGYADMTDLPNFMLDENKTGVKKWDQKRVDAHGQIDFYLFLVYLVYQIHPDKMKVRLHWLPTQEGSDFSIKFVEPIKYQTFHTTRTMKQLMLFAKRIRDTVEKMQDYASRKKLSP